MRHSWLFIIVGQLFGLAAASCQHDRTAHEGEIVPDAATMPVFGAFATASLEPTELVLPEVNTYMPMAVGTYRVYRVITTHYEIAPMQAYEETVVEHTITETVTASRFQQDTWEFDVLSEDESGGSTTHTYLASNDHLVGTSVEDIEVRLPLVVGEMWIESGNNDSPSALFDPYWEVIEVGPVTLSTGQKYSDCVKLDHRRSMSGAYLWVCRGIGVVQGEAVAPHLGISNDWVLVDFGSR